MGMHARVMRVELGDVTAASPSSSYRSCHQPGSSRGSLLRTGSQIVAAAGGSR
jgi:hypothetical protein